MKWKEEYCEMLVEHMTEGYSYESFAGKLGVTRDCLYKWEKRHEAFLYSKNIGFAKMLMFYEKTGIDAMKGLIPNFNATSWVFQMKNKCKWTDRVESTTIEVSKKDTEDLVARAEEILEEIRQ